MAVTTTVVTKTEEEIVAEKTAEHSALITNIFGSAATTESTDSGEPATPDPDSVHGALSGSTSYVPTFSFTTTSSTGESTPVVNPFAAFGAGSGISIFDLFGRRL